MRRPTLLLSVILGLGALTGCSGGGPYCDAVDRGQEQLATFGERTDAAYASYADITAEIAQVAPESVKKDWNQIAKATRRVVVAHRKADIALQDMQDEVKVNSLSQADIDRLETAHATFNDTSPLRKDMVEHVHDECGIDLSEK